MRTQTNWDNKIRFYEALASFDSHQLQFITLKMYTHPQACLGKLEISVED